MLMTATNYLNFDLALDHTEDGYFVRVLASPAGVAFRPFSLPFAWREIETFQPFLTQLGDYPAEHAEAQQDKVRELGERLFQALFRESVRSVWQESYQLAYQARARLRLRLHTASVPDLAHWPWEFLYDPDRQEFLALAAHTSLVRYVDRMHQIVPLKAEAPLRLLVVIASPGGYPLLAIEREWTDLLDKLDHLAVEGKLIIELVLKPTLHDLQRRLRQGHYHLLHFLGHGAYQSQMQEHQLIFEDEIGRSRPVSGQHLGALLRDHFSMRLVTVQACTGAQPARQNPYIGVAQNLVQRGLPAVVAMQAPLAGHIGLTFADDFYTAIANRIAVDVAMTEARRAVWSNERNIAWSTLALISRTPDGRLFEPVPPTPQPAVRRPYPQYGGGQ